MFIPSYLIVLNGVLMIVAFILVAYAWVYVERLRQESGELKVKAEGDAKARELAVDAKQLLHDMTAHGHAIVRIVPVSPTDVILRSPR